ncbi:AbfB domain-containing protein [Streptomyces sp. MNU89]|uniref:AbfB domain-containing protein n=1 Tax=Streptomyces sp. MNU89 TaxID=2560025 RepID=UPI001E310AD5|nr:AbfB domain-containing protein [Streptomyces sp. MNU89]MCC9741935.1 AbfB domain-containing protein [Streptomyces sp. MNU89]
MTADTPRDDGPGPDPDVWSPPYWEDGAEWPTGGYTGAFPAGGEPAAAPGADDLVGAAPAGSFYGSGPLMPPPPPPPRPRQTPPERRRQRRTAAEPVGVRPLAAGGRRHRRPPARRARRIGWRLRDWPLNPIFLLAGLLAASLVGTVWFFGMDMMGADGDDGPAGGGAAPGHRHRPGADPAHPVPAQRPAPGVSGKGGLPAEGATANRSFQSVNYPKRYLRQRDGAIFLDPVSSGPAAAADAKDATFTVMPGLADDKCYSFKTANGKYLRQQKFRVRVSAVQDTGLFRQDATFCATEGMVAGATSFESYNFPGRFLRHRGFRLVLDRSDGSQLFKQDASFRVIAALS